MDSRAVAVVAVLFTAACQTDWTQVDQDGDGFTVADGDCMDVLVDGLGRNPAAVFPGADEIWYDGLDQDCDQRDDYDRDGDGWVRDEFTGRATVNLEGSGNLPGGDCDDADAQVHPDALERCATEADDDCDGTANEDDAVDPATFYVDADDDGWGDAAGTAPGCTPPEGYTETAGDCDDTNPDIHPDGTESCATVADDNCNGVANEGDATDATTWQLDADNDGYGTPDVTVTACDQPRGYVADDGVADCDDARPDVHPGGEERCATTFDDDCDGNVNEMDADDASTWYVDTDGDGWGEEGLSFVACEASPGYVSIAGDCDDTDANVRPDADEVCDGGGIDEDCDGLADAADPDAAGGSTWYRDADADGFGDPADAVTACSVPPGYTSEATDCDDTDPTAWPGAVETCAGVGVDEDCDGLPDDADPDVTGQTPWYADADADGWGDATTSTVACAAPTGWLADATDCDDTSADVHPGATEVCDDGGRDEDCDGLADLDDPDATGGGTWYADADADGWGDPATSLVSCHAPSGWLTDATDCDDTDPAVHPGATEACDPDATDEDCDGLADDDDPEGASGTSDWIRDDDGDGDADPGATEVVTLCRATAPWTGVSLTDCDDTDPLRAGALPETADEVDNDCDDLVDDGLRATGALVVSEIHYYAATSSAQWIEVYNPGATDLYADGVQVEATTAAGAQSFWVGPDGLVVPAGGYVVLCNTATRVVDDAAASLCDYAWGSDVNAPSVAGPTFNASFRLAGSTSQYVRLSLDGLVLDEVVYSGTSTPWPTRQSGASIQVSSASPDAADNDDGSNWCLSANPWATGSDKGTPGEPADCSG